MNFDTGGVYRITTTAGTEYVGRVVGMGSEFIGADEAREYVRLELLTPPADESTDVLNAAQQIDGDIRAAVKVFTDTAVAIHFLGPYAGGDDA